MSQSWANIPPSGSASVALKTSIPDALEALRSVHSGATEPPQKVAYMLWADTGSGLMKQRDAANVAWITLGSLTQRHDWILQHHELGSIGGSLDVELLVAPCDMTLERVRIVSNVTTDGSDGSNCYGVMISNLTQGQPLLGNEQVTDSNEIQADTPWDVVPDQNAELAAGDVVRVSFNTNGTGPQVQDLNGARVSLHMQGHTR